MLAPLFLRDRCFWNIFAHWVEMVLAERMDFNPELNVRMFLNVNRPHNNEVATSLHA
ncbi:hypothetical protein [Nostoc sp. CALU 1950]|uniref:hypothetical protein n=1 Tax=Nostoc sp. CALU 1950 TaxID=3104321 RepID=UPI003EBA3ED7